MVALDPHDFARLRNPLMRRLMPPRISLARVASITGMNPADLIEGIHRAAGLELGTEAREELDELRLRARTLDLPSRNGDDRPTWLAGRPAAVVDLLEMDRRLDGDPMRPIMVALKRLEPGSFAEIRHRWEPAPLYDIWRHMGLEHWALEAGADEWRIYVFRPLD